MPKVIRSTEFLRRSDEAEEQLEGGVLQTPEQIKAAEEQIEAGKVLKMVQKDTRAKFHVALDLDSNVVAQIDMGSKTKLINRNFLTKKAANDAIDGGRHECEHEHNDFCEEKVSLHMKDKKQFDALQSALQINDLDDYSLAEGFTETVTFDKHRVNRHSGYLRFVAITRKLDKLAKDYLGVSFIKMFRDGNVDSARFFELLRELANRIISREMLYEIGLGSNPANDVEVAEIAEVA